MSLTRIGPYRIVRLLGEGGMGRVYEAIHESIERRVAIKVLHAEFARKPEMLQRFVNEARAVNLINHPALVQISDHGQLPDKTAYIVMEFLDGQTLSTKLKAAGGQLPVLKMLQVGQQMSTALAAAHAKGIVHRDLKPDNIMLVKDDLAPGGERVKILDFGIAKLTNTPAQANGRTATGAIMGTPHYMSPEQCRGLHVTEKADVYSLGIVLYQVLSGRRPFDASEQLALLLQHIQEPPPPLGSLAPQTPPPLAELVECLLRKDPLERPPMVEISNSLAKLEATLYSSAHQPALKVRAGFSDVEKVIVELPPSADPPKTEVLQRRSTLGISLGETHKAIRSRRIRTIFATSLTVGSIILVSVFYIGSPNKSPIEKATEKLQNHNSIASIPASRSMPNPSEHRVTSQDRPQHLQLRVEDEPKTPPSKPDLETDQKAIKVKRVNLTELHQSDSAGQQERSRALALQSPERPSSSENHVARPGRGQGPLQQSRIQKPDKTNYLLSAFTPPSCVEYHNYKHYTKMGAQYLSMKHEQREALDWYRQALDQCRHPYAAMSIETTLTKGYDKSLAKEFYETFMSHFKPTGELAGFIQQRILALKS